MLRKDFYNLLVCPYCRLSFQQSLDSLFCCRCKRSFKIKNDIPFIVPDKFRLFQEKEKKRIKRAGSWSKLFVYKKKQAKTLPNKIILDIGCGESNEGTIGLDVYIPQKIPANFIVGSAELLPFADNSVDVVRNSYVIEHLLNPSDFILNCLRIARERVVIITDNSDWIGEVFMRLIGAGRIFHNEHMYKWSEEYMNNLIKKLKLNGEAKVLNLSQNPLVTIPALFGKLPRIGKIFYRDLMVKITK